MADKEYIEREYAIQLLEEHMTDAEAKSKTMVKDVYLMAKDHAKEYLSIIPAADVVEVVRCRDCANGFEASVPGSETLHGCILRADATPVDPDGYCNRGVRRG